MTVMTRVLALEHTQSNVSETNAYNEGSPF